MIEPHRISTSRKTFAEFLKITSLSHLLNLKELMLLWYLFSALFLVIWACIAWALRSVIHFPHIAVFANHLLTELYSWITCIDFAGIVMVGVLLFPLIWVRSALITKKS
jgi:hypothetical protein